MQGPDEIPNEVEFEADPPGMSLNLALARGVIAGLRRTCYVAGPLAVLGMIPGLALSGL